MAMKIGPHTGISLEPCAGAPAGPVMVLTTCADGNLPLFLLERVVRSAGGTFNTPATGPSPFPSFPWHEAQYATYIILPEVADVWGVGTVTTLVFCAIPNPQRAANALHKSTIREIMMPS
jgi:hypothetical protein